MGPGETAFVAAPREEGFVSSNDSSPSYVDRLAFELSSFGLVDHNRFLFASSKKCNSDSGASSGDLDHSLQPAHDALLGERMKEEALLATLNTQPQLPGSWFYEVGSDEPAGASPTRELHDELLHSRGRNVTESVEVPSSEHVAEIVGRQGCKIKALRAKTNTYIKTPVRGEDPVFVVTGRQEDVGEAKREIECAAEHFTQIRASRRHSQGGVPAPGHVTAYVRVPLRVVGLVVGPKGATIKRIQQDTHTYIITPSREREPIFEVTGLPQNVEAARKEIEQHIYQRTGNMPITDPTASIGSYDLHSLGSASAVGSRPSYGSLAASSALNAMLRRGSGLQNFDSQLASVYADMYGLLRSNAKSYSATASPPPGPFSSSSSTGSSGFSSSGPHSTGSSHSGYQPWSSAYSSLPFGDSLGSDLLASSRSLLTPLSQLQLHSQQQSVWSSSRRDEERVPLPSHEPFHLMMSSIWSDLESPRDAPAPSQDGTPIATA